MTRWRVAAIGAVIWGTAPLAAQQATVAGSVGYASGRYLFAERYETWSFLGSLSLDWRRVSLSVAVPVVAQDGTVLTQIGGVPVPTGGPEAGVVQRRQGNRPIPVRGGRRGGYGTASVGAATGYALSSGSSVPAIAGTAQLTPTDSLTVAAPGPMEVHVADPIVGMSVTAFESRDGNQRVSLEAWAKAPITTVASGVGTGAWDYAAGASASLRAGTVSWSSSVTWWMLGDLPDLPLRDALFYSVSLGSMLSAHWGIHSGVSGATRMFENADPPVTASVALMRLVGRRAVAASVGFGLTETASDLTVGMSVSASTRSP